MNEKRIQFLQFLINQKMDTLTPQTSMESPCGYRFPEAQEFLETTPGQEIVTLNYLAELGVFDRHLTDKIHLCPYCEHFALNFRETCPQCMSHLINSVDMIHHYACGFLSYEGQFWEGDNLRCPKCKKSIRHLGVDYERAATNYRCNACTFLFPEPDVSCLSIACGKNFNIDRATIQMIYSYRMTEKGVDMASRGTLDIRMDNNTYVDGEEGVYTYQFFEKELTREIQRASRYHRTFSLLLLDLEDMDVYQEQYGQEATKALIKMISAVIKITIRDCDMLAVYHQSTLAILLPETPEPEARDITNRLTQQIQEAILGYQGLDMPALVGLVEFSGSIGSSQQMMAKALSALETEKQQRLNELAH